jgi:hypothetical protein
MVVMDKTKLLVLNKLLSQLNSHIEGKSLKLTTVERHINIEYHNLRRILKEEKYPDKDELIKILKYLDQIDQLPYYLSELYPKFAATIYESFAFNPQKRNMLNEVDEIYLRNPRYHQVLTLAGFTSGYSIENLESELGKRGVTAAYELISRGLLKLEDGNVYSKLSDAQSSMDCVLDRIKMSTDYYDHSKRGSGNNVAFYVPMKLSKKAKNMAHQLTKEYFSKICQLAMNDGAANVDQEREIFFVAALMDDFSDSH